MKHSDDIVNLFQQFGGKADPYLELARKQEHKLSGERWPLVSADRGAVGDDVPAVDRRAGPTLATVNPHPQGPAPVRTEPTGWAQRSVPLAADIPAAVSPAPAVSVAPAPAVVPTPVPTTMPVADRLPPSAALSARSPLAGLAGLRAAATPAQSDPAATQPAALPVDLPSVFARLGGASAPAETAPPPAPWQPRKGHS